MLTDPNYIINTSLPCEIYIRLKHIKSTRTAEPFINQIFSTYLLDS